MHFLKRVKIPEQANKYPGQLSGGQQQRCALARAIEQSQCHSSHRIAQERNVLGNQQQSNRQVLETHHRQEPEKARNDAEYSERKPEIA